MERYDYIIVGGGSAGTTLASRLTEDPKTRVLLLEAGPDYRTADNPREMQVPNCFAILTTPEHAKYRYDDLVARRTPQQEPRAYWRGRGIGGSSSVNGQIAIRAIPDDFAWWVEEGCDGWGWDDILPGFCALEDDVDFGDKPYHGKGGPIPIWRPPLDRWGAVSLALRSATMDLGYGWSEDLNAPDATGAASFAFNARNDVRVSTADGYIEPARDRENLTVMGDTTVDHMCVDFRRVTGVSAMTPGGRREFYAREVIVAAGALHTPGVLMRSGIGPADAVRALGVTPVADLPVGKNLIDHSSVWIGLNLEDHAKVPDINHRQTGCCVRYSSGLAGARVNDMMMVSANILGYDEVARGRGVVVIATYQTFSRGLLQVLSRDPNVHPQIDLHMLSDERDLVRLRDGFKRLRQVLAHRELASITKSHFTYLMDDSDGGLPPDNASDAEIDGWLMDNVQETHHPVGTCRMGRADDPRSVVDTDCRVIGIDGLRVIDASVMPENPRANIHLTVIAMAETMAARIRAGQTVNAG